MSKKARRNGEEGMESGEKERRMDEQHRADEGGGGGARMAACCDCGLKKHEKHRRTQIPRDFSTRVELHDAVCFIFYQESDNLTRGNK